MDDNETCEECHGCAEAICDALNGFEAPGLEVKDCRAVLRENSHGNESVFAEVRLSAPEVDTWPLDSVNRMRDAIYEAARGADCELPIYLKLLPVEDMAGLPA